MQIQVNTDNTVEGSERLTAHVQAVIAGALNHVSTRVLRVEVHLGDENSPRYVQNDKRCMMKARVEGRRPRAVTHRASTLNHAIDGAADKLRKMLESDIGRLQSRRR